MARQRGGEQWTREVEGKGRSRGRRQRFRGSGKRGGTNQTPAVQAALDLKLVAHEIQHAREQLAAIEAMPVVDRSGRIIKREAVRVIVAKVSLASRLLDACAETIGLEPADCQRRRTA